MEATSNQHAAVTVPYGAWFDETEVSLPLPDGWTAYRGNPADGPAIDDAAIEQALASPIGGKSIRQLAVGKQSAAIAVDDLTRPTPTHRFLPQLIREITQGGIAQDCIHIIIGGASHRPMDAAEMANKYGEEIASKFRPIMHDFVGDDVRFVGWVRGGPVYLNRHFLDADLRIVVGGVIPHGDAGFGGGAKMVVPGLAGRMSIAHFHGALPHRPRGQVEADAGVFDRRAWAEAVARHVDVQTSVCATINSRRELAGLYVGDVVEAYRAAATQARRISMTPMPPELADGCDAVIVSAYPLDTDPVQMGKSVRLAQQVGAKLTIAINAASDGIFYHGMGMGSGVSVRRLLGNLPGFLTSPKSAYTWARCLATGIRKPALAARLCYFTLNHLAYDDFVRRDADRPPDESTRANGDAPLDRADVLLFSKRYPRWGFDRKYPGGRMYREWDALAADLKRRMPTGKALVLPCGPIQLLEQ